MCPFALVILYHCASLPLCPFLLCILALVPFSIVPFSLCPFANVTLCPCAFSPWCHFACVPRYPFSLVIVLFSLGPFMLYLSARVTHSGPFDLAMAMRLIIAPLCLILNC